MGKRTSIPLIQKYFRLEKFIFQSWFLLQTLLKEPLKLWLFYRILKQKEEKNRLSERWGKSQNTRKVFQYPHRPLLWFHTASVGETASILALATYLSQQKNYNILLTTATLSAKELISKHLLRNPNIALFHQYAPLDIPSWIQNFLNNWRPCGAIFVESELWPVRLKICQNKTIPVMLIGARLSPSSLKYWKYFPFLFEIILNCFSWISPKDQANAQKFQLFNQKIRYVFPLDLKFFTPPLAVDREKETFFKKTFRNKKIFFAVSTHQGEEAFFADAKVHIKNHQEWLFIFAPRHPERAKTLSNVLGKAPLFSYGEYPTDSDDFWIIDTIGDLGLFFSIADCSFIGGSLFPHGRGHNPYEALHFNLKTSTGLYHANWIETYSSLKDKVTNISTIKDFIRWIESDTPQSKTIEKDSNKSEIAQMAELIHQTVLKPR
ncbi:hypothetical protein FAI41_00235 [Acetobacteraceae bacterium]|nr:hypothetical protein FAI41_00235 [Acetobacteraceae bacterium]